MNGIITTPLGLSILTIILVSLIGFFLFKEGWKLIHIISLSLAILWAFLFFNFGSDLLTKFFLKIDASTFFIYFVLIFWGGLILFTIMPLLIKGQFRAAFKIASLIIAVALLEIAFDNVTFGPAAIGPNSPYLSQGSLCSLDTTYFAEDVFFGCMIEKLGINPFGILATFLGYVVASLILLLTAIGLIGFRRTEKQLFSGGYKK